LEDGEEEYKVGTLRHKEPIDYFMSQVAKDLYAEKPNFDEM